MKSFLGLCALVILSFSGCSEEKQHSKTIQSTKSSPIQEQNLSRPNTHLSMFVLHRFNDNEHRSTSITNEKLISHFEYLKKHGYYVATLSEIIEKIHNKKPIPEKWVHFSIDDSYKSFYDNGLPLFKKYDYPFSLYVYVEATERHFHDFMSWDEIKALMPYGEIGLHSYGHKHLTKLSAEALKKDTKKALELFEQHLGFKPKAYAYPYGEYDQNVKKIIKSFEFDLILNQNQGAISAKSPLDDLDRIALTGEASLTTKLKIKHLPAIWKKIDLDPKQRLLRSVEIEIDPSYKSVQIFVSGDTWQTLKPKNGKITKIFNIKLKNDRSRIIIKTPDNAWSSKIIIL